MSTTAEQQARDMLERMGVEDAQEFTDEDIVELANLISHYDSALIKDAMRYRKLRDLAMNDGCLEATIAIGQFDFIGTAECFDADVDSLFSEKKP